MTGCTQGIGRALAEQLCTYGFSLVLVGRNAPKLAATRDQLKAAFPGLEFETVEFDFALGDPLEYRRRLDGPLGKVGLLGGFGRPGPALPQ